MGGFSAKISPPTSSPPHEQQLLQPQTQAKQKTLAIEPLANVRIEELTGLQRQLAEHRSALLPQVIAFREYHEDRATAEPFDHTFSRKSLTPNEDVSDAKDSGDYYRPSDEMIPVGGRGPPVGHPQHPQEKENRRREQQQQKSKEGGGLLSVFSKRKNNSGTISTISNISNIGGGPTPGGVTTMRDGSLESSDRSSQDTKEPTPVEELAAMSTSENEILSQKGHLSYDYADPYDLGGRSSMSMAGTRSEFPLVRAEAEAMTRTASFTASPSYNASSTMTRDSISLNRPHSPPSKKVSSSKFSTLTGSSGNLSTYSSSSTSVAGSGNAKMPRSNIETTFRVSLDSTSPSPRSPKYTDLPRHSTSFSRMDSPTTAVDLVKMSLLPPPRQQQSSWRRSKNFKEAPVNVGGDASTSAPSAATVRTGDRQDNGDEDEDEDQEKREALSASTTSISYAAGSSPTGAAAADTRSPSSHPFGPRYSQRSVDNLASAYYYKRASELSVGNSQSGTPIASSALIVPSPLPSPSPSTPTSTTMQYQMYAPASTRSAVPLSLHSTSGTTSVLGNVGTGTPPLSPRLKSYSSHSSGVNTAFPSSPRHKSSGEGYSSSPSSSLSSSPSGRATIGRNSPSPTQFLEGSHSASTTMTMASAHLGSTFNSTGVEESNTASRSNSFTNSQMPHMTTAHYTSSPYVSFQQSRFTAEDPWTLAMMNRAQAQNLSSSSPSSVSSSSQKFSYLQGQQQQQQGQGLYGDDHSAYFSRPSMARTASE